LAAASLSLHVIICYVITNQVICRAIHVRIFSVDVDTDSSREKLQWLAISFCLMAVSFALANFLPFFQVLGGVVGAVATMPLTFGAPPFFYLMATKAHGHQVGALEKTLLYGMLALNVVLLACSIANAAALIREWASIDKSFDCMSLAAWTWP
jgi:hypothetical protein